MEKGLIEKTGKDLTHWISLVKSSGITKHGEIIKWLKAEHDFTHGFANFVALKAREADAASHNPEDLVDAQYQGKEDLKPIYEKFINMVKGVAPDSEIVPKKANVSIKRKRQFVLIQPTTKSRIDLGLKFNDKPLGGRLEDPKLFGGMCSHRVQINSIEELDQELLDLVKEAYDEAG